jgi:hypothetical protein
MKCLVSVLGAIAVAVLLAASRANAEPGGPAPVILSPGNGATVTTQANEEIMVEFTCPSYIQKNVNYEYSTSWYGYHVVFANSAELNPSGEFATPFVLYRGAPYPINASEDVCRTRLPSYFGNKYGTYYLRIERDQINSCGSAQNNCREVFGIQSFTTTAPPPVVVPTPSAPAQPTNPAAGGRPKVVVWTGCGLSVHTAKSSKCPIRGRMGAFIKSSKEISYKLCVRFPEGESLCTQRPQLAEAATTYVNKITGHTPGRYVVTWVVEGRRYKRIVHRMFISSR